MGLRCPSAESWAWALALCEQGWQSHVAACGSHPFLPLQHLAPGAPALRELVGTQLSHDTESQSVWWHCPGTSKPALVAVVQKEVGGYLEDPNKSGEHSPTVWNSGF